MCLGVFLVVFFLFHRGLGENSALFDAVVEHSFDHGKHFNEKGIISSWNIEESFPLSKESLLTKEEETLLQDLISHDGLYTVRTAIKDKSLFIHGYVPACQLVASEGKLAMTVSLDSSGYPVALSLVAKNRTCGGSMRYPRGFDTLVFIQRPNLAIGPETQEYLSKLERQREEKLRQEQQDNRSFLSKYWMYILPAVFFLMMLNSASPNADGGSE